MSPSRRAESRPRAAPCASGNRAHARAARRRERPAPRRQAAEAVGERSSWCFLPLFLSADNRTGDSNARCAGSFTFYVMPAFPSRTRWPTLHRPDPALRAAFPNIVVFRRMSKRLRHPSSLRRRCGIAEGAAAPSDLNAWKLKPAPYFAEAGNAGNLSTSRASCWMMTVALEPATIFLTRSSEASVWERSVLNAGTPLVS